MNVPLDILLKKAEDFIKKLREHYFFDSESYLTKWKKRNKIGFRKTCGEKQDADVEGAEKWISKHLPKSLKGYVMEQIFNTDESGLSFRAILYCMRVLKNDFASLKNIK